MQAKDYAGGDKVYSKRIPLEDVAWIHSDEGQYAPIGQEGFYQRAGAEERLTEDEAAWNDLIDRYRAADKTEWKNKQDEWYIDRLNQKNLLYINKKRTVRWVATRKGAAGSHNAPLTKQSLYGLSIANEMDLSKLKKEHRGFYQRAGAEKRLAEDEAAWNDLIDRYRAADKTEWKNKQDGTLFHVMDVPLVMQLLHIPYDQLHVFGSFFAHAVNQKHKGMTLELLRQLPRKMADPLMIARGNFLLSI